MEYDPIHDLMVCDICHATDLTDYRRYDLDPELLPEGWSPPTQKVIPLKGIVITPRIWTLHGDWKSAMSVGLVNIHIRKSFSDIDEPMDETDAKKMAEYAMIDAYEASKHSFDLHHDVGKVFTDGKIRLGDTHYRFAQTSFRRCLEGDDLVCKYPRGDNRNYHGSKDQEEQCKGCPNAIESSLYEREHDVYPELCFYTLGIIPEIDDPIPPRLLSEGEPCVIADTYGNEELAKLYESLDNQHGTIYPKSPKTITVYRDNPDKHRPARVGYIPPYASQIYANTPIGNLLEAAPKPGRAALYRLREYFQYALYLRRTHTHDELFAWYQEPTRQKVIAVFMKCQRPYAVGFRHPTDFIGKDQAEKYFSLLTEFKIVKIFESVTRGKDDQLIYATMKRVPTCSSESPDEYYLDAQTPNQHD